MLNAPQFYIFGLSGVGKTTLLEQLSSDKRFYLPRQLVTRAPRADDNSLKFEYVTREKFKQIKQNNQLLISYDDGVHCYGYKRNAFMPSHFLLLYGLPAKLNKTKKMGGITVLIEGDALAGLQMRGDPGDLIEKRRKGNEYLKGNYFDNPLFRQNMDLILTNEFGLRGKFINLFKRFAIFKRNEIRAVQGNIKSLFLVLKMYHHPIRGMSHNPARHCYFVQIAFKNELLSSLFYLKLIRDSSKFQRSR